MRRQIRNVHRVVRVVRAARVVLHRPRAALNVRRALHQAHRAARIPVPRILRVAPHRVAPHRAPQVVQRATRVQPRVIRNPILKVVTV